MILIIVIILMILMILRILKILRILRSVESRRIACRCLQTKRGAICYRMSGKKERRRGTSVTSISERHHCKCFKIILGSNWVYFSCTCDCIVALCCCIEITFALAFALAFACQFAFGLFLPTRPLFFTMPEACQKSRDTQRESTSSRQIAGKDHTLGIQCP